MSGLRPPVICLVTDRTRYRAGALLPAIAAAAAAGIDLIHIRERDLPDRDLLALVRAAISAAHGARARIVVNERVDIALAAGASGVHLRGDSVACASVRRIAPPGFLVGRSVHGAAEAAAAAAGGACDYLVFGAVRPSGSKPAAGFGALAEVCRAVRARTSEGGAPVPVLAIGGLAEEDAVAAARAGAAGVAAIGLFAGATDLARLASALRSAFDS